jgi:hypothetical protein
MAHCVFLPVITSEQCVTIEDSAFLRWPWNEYFPLRVEIRNNCSIPIYDLVAEAVFYVDGVPVETESATTTLGATPAGETNVIDIEPSDPRVRQGLATYDLRLVGFDDTPARPYRPITIVSSEWIASEPRIVRLRVIFRNDNPEHVGSIRFLGQSGDTNTTDLVLAPGETQSVTFVDTYEPGRPASVSTTVRAEGTVVQSSRRTSLWNTQRVAAAPLTSIQFKRLSVLVRHTKGDEGGGAIHE